MASIESYTISVPEEERERLIKKLEATTLPDELDQAGWDYGAPLADVKRLATYWREKFDWRKQEAKLNELPNFKTPIQVDGFEPLDIHFVHQKSDVDGAIPLLFSHGCALLVSTPGCQLLIQHRAWQLYRSHQNPPSTRQWRQRGPGLPHRGSLSPELRLLLRNEEKRLWPSSIRGDISQAHAQAWVR